MKVYFLAIILYYINLTFLKALNPTQENRCAYTLHAFNNGPVTLDVPVTISAFLECTDEDKKYLFVFEDDLKRKIVIPGNISASTSFLFTDKPGERIIKVSAFASYPVHMKVASGSTTVDIREYVPGNLEFSDVVVDNNGQINVAAGKDINITVEIKYPHQILESSEFSYSWDIGEKRFTGNHPYIIHRFMDPGVWWVRASVVARIPSNGNGSKTRYKWGYFDTSVIVKYPFVNINISGNTYLQHGQLLNLEITCNGSGPVDYCWKVLPPSGNHTNLSCTNPVSVMECSFPIIYYFHDSGDYMLAILADNIVSSKQRNIEIHIYDVSLRPQLSTVIIPVVCTVLVLLIVVTAAVIHIRRNKSYDIETADFDFLVTDESGTVVTETSWEYMHRTFLQLLRIPYMYCAIEIKKTNYGAVVQH